MEDKNLEFRRRMAAFYEGVGDFLPHLSINCVIFGFNGEKLKVLVTNPFMTKTWLIPGDFIFKSESIDEAAYRSMRTQLGLEDIFLRQFRTFGESDRSFSLEMDEMFQLTHVVPNDYAWFTRRFVTIGYYACVDLQKSNPKPNVMFDSVRWIDIDEIDMLGFDHEDIVREARRVLAKDIMDLPVIANLLPREFTIPELQKLHESILDRDIDRGNFRSKILRTGILVKVGERQTASTRRPPGLYRFNMQQYEEVLQEENKIGF